MKKMWMGGVLFLCAVAGVFGQSNAAAFFRISSPSNAVITELDPAGGTIAWSNGVSGVTNQLQRAHDLTGTNNWVDLVQLVSTGAVTSEKIIDLSPPAGMVLIPGGSFSMGDSKGDGYDRELPVHNVYVSAFYMDKTEVTNEKMVEVMQWAYDHGKLTVTSTSVTNAAGNQQELLDLDSSYCRITWDGSLFGIKSEKGEGYPCVEVSWYGAAAYCNYRSEMENREPAYNLSTWSCDWSANGYRLPTEAKWEKAARGGRSGSRFPWGDTISHDKANYYGQSGSYSYDYSDGFHPAYTADQYPYTSQVGAFGETGYGLSDMTGNVWEWCHDWYDSGYYGSSPYSNPKGASAGSYRVIRGGCWLHNAILCRVSHRIGYGPTYTNSRLGFRAVLPAN